MQSCRRVLGFDWSKEEPERPTLHGRDDAAVGSRTWPRCGHSPIREEWQTCKTTGSSIPCSNLKWVILQHQFDVHQGQQKQSNPNGYHTHPPRRLQPGWGKQCDHEGLKNVAHWCPTQLGCARLGFEKNSSCI